MNKPRCFICKSALGLKWYHKLLNDKEVIVCSIKCRDKKMKVWGGNK